ncbi:hypothetical protein [Streptococcus chenjunshii]|nr:hypothetical protein [Streptococcus chenjunshii]
MIACTNDEKRSELTVSNIVKKIYFAKTTTTELEEIFGAPQKVVKNSEKVNDTYFLISSGEVTDKLNQLNIYIEASKIDMNDYNKQFDDTEDNPFDSYYQYSSRRSGLKYVRFYIADRVVYDVEYGPITDESIAKKDRYLRQILD